MSHTVEELTLRLRQVLQAEPAVSGSLKFLLHGAGVIWAEGTTVTNEDAPADCTLLISKPDLDDLASGVMDTSTALMDGRLELQGDIGVAMAMQDRLLLAWR